MNKPSPQATDKRLPALEDWHAFIEQYSNLIFSVIRRYLVRESEDDWRTVYVDTLKVFYEGQLVGFDGRAALSTWVTLITRSRSLDFLRGKYGRRDLPSWLGQFSEPEQEVYRLYYLQGWDIRHIAQKVSQEGLTLSADEVVETLRRVESRLDRRTRRRLAYELQGRSVGALTGQMLEYLDHLQESWRDRERDQDPLRVQEQADALAGAQRLRSLLADLPDREHEALELRYFRGYSARRISSRLQLENPRRAYTLIERGLRRLRTLFERENQDHRDPPAETDLRARTDGEA